MGHCRSFGAFPLTHRIAAGMALAFELASPFAMATTVASCDDTAAAATTPGTLRYEVAHAASGDTIDFNLPPECNSTISLKTGELTVTQNDLTITGAGSHVTLEKYQGVYQGVPTTGRVLDHQGTGTLHLNYVTVRYGSLSVAQKKVYGGCIYSKGSVSLYRSSVSDCFVAAYGVDFNSPSLTTGGGIYAAKDVSLAWSTVSGSTADGISTAAGNAYAGCGGVHAQGMLYAGYSTISGNQTVTPFGLGGGACSYGGGLISRSTISGNQIGTAGGAPCIFCAMAGGGLFAGGASSNQLLILDSTISGNASDQWAGGVLSYVTTTVSNSTIAFNTAKSGNGVLVDAVAAAGLAMQTSGLSHAVYSSIIAGNTVGAVESDLSIYSSALGGSHNLIQGTVQASIVPNDTITGQCPLLGPLRDNGGPTLTHALRSGSPAVDAGYLHVPLPYDQRNLPRQSPSGSPDIGAYEVQQDDIVFNSSFEGCT